MTGFTSILWHVNAIYILFVTQIRSQYQNIWYDMMNTGTGWSISSSSHVWFNYDSPGCHTNTCLKTEGSSGVNHYAVRSTNVAAYSSLQLQYGVSTDDLEAGKTCTVYYAYNSQSNKQVLKAIDPPDIDRNYYWNQVVDLPSASSATTVWVWLETTTNGNTASSTDMCYWDNVYLRGILTPVPAKIPTRGPAPTPKPTPKPTTKNPTPNPTKRPTTKQPSPNPTKRPTPNPTKRPTVKPTTNPTKRPTPNPTKRPTDRPTSNPTKPPTDVPTTNPTRRPTDPPTRVPSVQPTTRPTDNPTDEPTPAPTEMPTDPPSLAPTLAPTAAPSPVPTDLPTPSGALACGDETTGAYTEGQVSLVVNVPFTKVDVTFDATQSQFNLQEIEIFLAYGNTYWGSSNGASSITLENLPVGNYKFVMHGDTTPGTYG
eukprot:973853_1